MPRDECIVAPRDPDAEYRMGYADGKRDATATGPERDLAHMERLALLRELEWAGNRCPRPDGFVCPSCGASKEEGHHYLCLLSDALLAAGRWPTEAELDSCRIGATVESEIERLFGLPEGSEGKDE